MFEQYDLKESLARKLFEKRAEDNGFSCVMVAQACSHFLAGWTAMIRLRAVSRKSKEGICDEEAREICTQKLDVEILVGFEYKNVWIDLIVRREILFDMCLWMLREMNVDCVFIYSLNSHSRLTIEFQNEVDILDVEAFGGWSGFVG